MSEAFVAISRAFPEAATAYLLCHSASQHTAFYRGGGLHGGPLMSISSLQKYFFFFFPETRMILMLENPLSVEGLIRNAQE